MTRAGENLICRLDMKGTEGPLRRWPAGEGMMLQALLIWLERVLQDCKTVGSLCTFLGCEEHRKKGLIGAAFWKETQSSRADEEL